MSECVVRMEIPENCLKCPLRNQCEIFCDWFWHVVGRAARKPYPKPFDKGCRIVCQLPEGHGRLVDGDELYTTVKAHDTKRTVNQVRSGVIEEKHICLYDICQAQTIVPAERRSE